MFHQLRDFYELQRLAGFYDTDEDDDEVFAPSTSTVATIESPLGFVEETAHLINNSARLHMTNQHLQYQLMDYENHFHLYEKKLDELRTRITRMHSERQQILNFLKCQYLQARDEGCAMALIILITLIYLKHADGQTDL